MTWTNIILCTASSAFHFSSIYRQLSQINSNIIGSYWHSGWCRTSAIICSLIRIALLLRSSLISINVDCVVPSSAEHGEVYQEKVANGYRIIISSSSLEKGGIECRMWLPLPMMTIRRCWFHPRSCCALCLCMGWKHIYGLRATCGGKVERRSGSPGINGAELIEDSHPLSLSDFGGISGERRIFVAPILAGLLC